VTPWTLPKSPFVNTSIGWKTSPERCCSRAGFINTRGNGGSAVSDPNKAETLPKPLPDIETTEGALEAIQRAAKGGNSNAAACP
jgi:hypothetical protein